ncbi:MAG: hypothetical protein QOF18_30 [Frankiaceae bacterium]|jgi:hypothetical protein|nr:hypothetical protein [Frankiaceae bacterium]
MTHDDLIERRLHDAMGAAHDDPRWAGPEWSDPVRRVRRAARSRRAGRVGAAVAGLAVVSVGAGIALHALSPGADRVRVLPPATGSQGSGADWLLTPQQFDAYVAAHPSPSPTANSVASPAPVTADLQQLESDLRAGVPGALTINRSDSADGGQRGHSVIWATRADGTQVVVERYKLDYPLEAGLPDGPRPTATPDGPATSHPADETFTSPRSWSDGSAYTVLTGDALGYSTGAGEAWSGPYVWTVTPDGWFTAWTAPVTVDTLTGWAQAADVSFVAAG